MRRGISLTATAVPSDMSEPAVECAHGRTMKHKQGLPDSYLST